MNPNPAQFESLRERLLQGGVSPRAVRRYLRELREHFDDVVRAELAGGASHANAERSAWQRLGREDELAQSVLARPELRATGARMPAAVYGAGPACLWLGGLALTLTALVLATQSAAGDPQPTGLRELTSALSLLALRVLPVAISAALLVAAFRQRLAPRWPLIGAAALALLAGTTRIEISFADALGARNQLLLSSSLIAPLADALGPLDLAEHARGLGRAALMLAASALPYLFLRKQHQRQHSA
jgi:hypothetical protein